jgi:hypothetical protein
MIRIVIFAAALGVGALALGPSTARADYQVGSYTGICHYHCCDANNNCSIYQFYQGTGQGSYDAACTWAAVCSQQGDIGWGASPYPQSEKNSSLRLEPGCWKGWETNSGKFYVKPC